MTVVKIDTRKIGDWTTFHTIFAERFGFPDFYGRNMNAWIDCLTSLDDPDAGMTTVHAPSRKVLTLELEHSADFARRCPELFKAIVECAAFVNSRRVAVGERAVIDVAFSNPG